MGHGSNGSVFWITAGMGHMGRLDAVSFMTHLHIYLKHVVKATFVVGDN